MHLRSPLIWVALIIAPSAQLALAGPNGGGTLLVHWTDVTYSASDPPACEYQDLFVDTCDEINIVGDGYSPDPTYIMVYAAFPRDSAPRLTGVSFGLGYAEWILQVVDYGACADGETTFAEWPSGNTSGTTVYWDDPKTDVLVPVYWFLAYDYDFNHDTAFSVREHPLDGGLFFDDSVPSQEDRITDYGRIGFSSGGYRPCPIAGERGACCDIDGQCFLLTLDECVDRDGGFRGPGSTCDADPCPVACTEPRPLPQPSIDTPEPSTLPFELGVSRTGPNAGGVLILHATGQTYCVDDGSYCGQANLTDCDDAVVRIDSPEVSVFHVLAAFPDGSSPRLAGVTFGIEYSDCIYLPDWAACGDFELSDASWPASGTGTAVTWIEANTTQLVDIYWFAGYSYGLPASFELVAHPWGGTSFADDAVPSNIDPIAGLSMLGFYSPGRGVCPENLNPAGACCFPGGTQCVIVPETQCFNGGGEYFGDGSVCDPSPCGPTPTEDGSWGRIKHMFR